MDNRTKENAVEKVVRAMSQIPGISDLMQEKDDQGWRVKCVVHEVVQFSMTLRQDADLAIIHAAITTGMEEAEAFGLGNKMTEGIEGLRFSVYGENLNLQRACAPDGLVNQEAERFLFVNAFSVIGVIRKFINRVVPRENEAVLEKPDMESEKQEIFDPDKLFDRVSTETGSNEKFTDKKSVKLRDVSMSSGGVCGFLPITFSAAGNGKTGKPGRNKKSGDRAECDGMDVPASLLMEGDGKSGTAMHEREMECQEQNASDGAVDTEAGKANEMEEISQMMKEIQEEEEEDSDITFHRFDANIPQEIDADPGGQREESHGANESLGESDDIVQTQTDAVIDEEMKDAIGELEHMQGLGAEVAAQMRKMYGEIGRIFDIRKKQADQRESTLNAFADKLDKREKMIWEKGENAQRVFKEKLEESTRLVMEQKKQVEAECQKLNSRIEAEKEKISVLQKDIEYQQEKIQAERDTLEIQKRDFEERMALAEKSQALSGLIEEELADLEELRKHLENSKQENISQQEHMQSIETQYSGKIAKITGVSKKKDEVINKLKSQVEKDVKEKDRFTRELEKAQAENQELQGEIEKLRGEAEEYLEHIGRLDSQIEMEKEKAQEAVQECDKERKEKDRAIIELQEMTDTEKIAARLQRQLKEIGIDVERVASGSDVILRGDNGQYRINIHAEIGAIRIEKPLRKGQKYRVTVDKWNEEDIGTAYLLSATKIVCKAACRDVQKTVMDIMHRLENVI